MNFTRRSFLKGGIAAAGLGGAAAWKLTTTYDLEWKHFGLPLLRLRESDPIRILHLSDIHASDAVPFDYIDRVFHQIQESSPDVICLTGDFISDTLPQPLLFNALLRRLSDTAACFAVTGNHDGGKWAASHGGYTDASKIKNLLSDAGIRVLTNQSETICLRGTSIHITGLGDLWAGEFDPATAFAEVDAGENPHLVLSHNPDTKDALREYAWDLMLSGHTHGGQLRIPGMGAPLAPVHDLRFTEGIHRWRDRYLCISKGIGNLHGLRINCPPDVCMLELG